MEGREQLRRGLKYGIRGLSQKGIGDPPSCFASRSARRPCPRQPPRKRSSPIHTNTLNSEAYQSPNPYRAIRGKAAFGNTIDVHTHLYLPGYMDLLRRRAEVPRIIPAPPGSASDAPERLLILPGEDADGRTLSGRPIGREYWSVEEKLSFMDVHGIQTSVLSPANPWLDFLPPLDALRVAQDLNDELHALCSSSYPAPPSFPSSAPVPRFFCFGFLPLHPLFQSSQLLSAIVRELERLATPPLSSTMRGVILPAQHLDHPLMDGVYEACQRLGLVLFIHPHYGVGNGSEVNGDYGHVLPLALGFPFETSVAAARLLLSGYLDRYPDLRVLLAHSGGTLPFLAGRLDSCVAHDPAFVWGREGRKGGKLKHLPSLYLRRNFFFDSVVYHQAGYQCLRALLGEAGKDRVMWGTDHPFFPPVDAAEGEGSRQRPWPSAMKNYEILWEEGTSTDEVKEGAKEEKWREGVLWRNASKLLCIPTATGEREGRE